MIMFDFGFGRLPGAPLPAKAKKWNFGSPPAGSDPPATEQLLAAGWGYAYLNAYSVQADNGAGLTKGIIGLTNHGQPRKPNQWGALRAWGWGASRALDYLATVPEVDSTRVGIAGVSRYGKAALVAMAFDQRFAMGLIASSGAGGTALYRRNFGESPENLAGSGAYHWMAGSYLKYATEESAFGRRTAADLPVFAVGFAAAFGSAWVAVKVLLRLLQTATLRPFAWYRLALAAVILVVG